MDEQIPQPEPRPDASGQEQAQYQAPTPEMPQRHFLNKKFIITFVILLLLGSGAYAGIWYWQNQQLAQEVTPTFTPRVDATADWKTYTNTQYGFEFKYPSDWQTSESNNPDPQILKNIDVLMSGYKLFELSITATVKNISEANEKKFAQFIFNQAKPEQIVLAGTIWNKYSGIVGGEGESEWPYQVLVYTNHNGRIYELRYAYIKAAKNYASVVEQILSTFKFTNSVDTSTWKTYTNTQYGFEFKYPADYAPGTSAGGYLGSTPNFLSGGQNVMGVSMPSGIYLKSTDFDTAFFMVSINSQLSAKDCAKEPKVAPDGVSVVPQDLTQTQIVNGVSYYKGESGGVGLGHQADDRFFNAYRNGVCYELNEGLRTATGSDQVTQQVDSKDVFSKLDSILNTFKFTK